MNVAQGRGTVITGQSESTYLGHHKSPSIPKHKINKLAQGKKNTQKHKTKHLNYT